MNEIISQLKQATGRVESFVQHTMGLHTISHEVAMVIVAAAIGAGLGAVMALFYHVKTLGRR